MRAPGRGRDDGAPPVTRAQLVSDLRALGVRPGHSLLVNASLRSIGWVEGGAPTVIAALREVIGPTGNLVAPTGTEVNSHSSRAHRARIAGLNADEVRAYRLDMPAFDQETTPSGMGAIAEALRTTVGANRSAHPQSSFAAVGPEAGYLMADHRLDCHLGEDSPLAKLYKLGAQVLLIGTGFASCTAFHLAEYRYTPDPPMRTYAGVVATDGRRHWASYQDVALDDQEFELIGKSLAEAVIIRSRDVGAAECRLVPLINAVDFAAEWMARHRS